MEVGLVEMSVFLRICAILFLVLTASLLGSDAQTKLVFYLERKATFRDLDALIILVYVESGAACYYLLQVCKSPFSAWFEGNLKWPSPICLAWVCFLLDQAYITFAANSAALESSLFAVTGEKEFQWMKLCNRFTRFCIQIGGALLCGYVASFLMAVISFLSAFNLFRNYSPKRFLSLKEK
ncbi:hypothetical protein CJ030_MR8G028306 [Morella rubra]|uniref:CASP-like protein n=1 Tax=Morella rubra TaxID=262757 RepID=A0A6A1UV02_9ROSI|nr:hypothetical protein CJ030_MR8G028306 [Morella rubra]